MHPLPAPARHLLLSAVAACAACATGSTFRSGVGDTFLEHPPYVAGAEAGAERLGHLRLAYQRGGSQAEIFDPSGGAGTPMERLLAEMNAELDALGATVPVVAGERPQGTPPDVWFGCETDASGDCLERDPTKALGREGTTVLKLAVGRPSDAWTAWARGAAERAGVGGLLVLTVEIGQYFVRQVGLKGSKQVELGRGHTAALPWLTSLETSFSVLQLTGARMALDGRAVRIGAEGMLPRRTSLGLSAIGAQELITDEDVEQLRTRQREDLPGRPLVWRVALRNLVADLTGRNDLAVR